MRKGTVVAVNQDHLNGIMGSGPKFIMNDTAVVQKSYWYNGEGWLRLKLNDGSILESPDVFWSEIQS